MGLLDSNMIKAEDFKKKNILCSSVSTSGTYSFATQEEKRLIVEINIAGVAATNISITFTAKNYRGISSNWISALFVSNPDVVVSSNVISLGNGRFKFELPRRDLASYSQIDIQTTVPPEANISMLYYYVEEKDIIIDSRNIALTDTIYSLPSKKKYLIRSLSMSSVTADNYLALHLEDKDSHWSINEIKSNSPRVVRAAELLFYPSSDYYIDLSDVTDNLKTLHITKAGTISCYYIIKEVEAIPDLVEKVSIYTTNKSLGDSYFYKRKPLDQMILATVTITKYVAGTNSISFHPRDISGRRLNDVVGSRVGSSVEGSVFEISGEGTFDVLFKLSKSVDRINSSADIMNGTEVTLEMRGIDYSTPNEVVPEPFYKGEGILVEKYMSNVRLYSHYENWEAYINSTNDTLSIVRFGVKYNVTIDTLPGWKTGDSINVMGFIPYKQGGATADNYSRETSVRLCMVTSRGNIYHNYPAADSNDLSVVSGGISKFDLGTIYQTVYGATSLSSERIPSLNSSLTSEEQKTHRYEPGLPAWNYQQHTDNVGGYQDTDKTIEYGSGGQPPVLDKKNYKHIRIVHPFDFGTNPQNASYPYSLGGHLCEPFAIKPKMTVFTPYVGINAKKNIVLGTVDGGRSWYVLHELGIGSFMSKFGNSLDYSSIGTYVSGDLSVSERLYNYPASDDKEPANAFKYKAPVLISSIATSGGKTTVTTSTAHGITDGKYIVFKKNNSGYFDFLENTIVDGSTADLDSNSCGNGRFYAAKVLSSTTFELLQCMGGMDEKINTHHVHSANVSKDGVVISCGEKYPNGWVLYVPIHEIDDFEYKNIWAYKYNNPYIIRLNSSQNAVQRPVGFILNDDSEQSFLFGSDEAHIDRGYVQITGRTDVMKRNSAGVFLGNLVDIDDISKTECVLEMEEASLGIVKKQGFYIVLGMSRKTYISKDAKDWIEFPLISKYQGEGIREIYFISETNVYKVSHK